MNTEKQRRNTSTKVLNFANAASESVGSNIRDNVLSAVGATRNVSVVIDCDTVTLYGGGQDGSVAQALAQVTKAGGSDCVAVTA